MKITLKYFPPTDNLYIQFGNKKSAVGDDDFQDDIMLFRDSKTGRIFGIEIMEFSKFEGNYIQISENEVMDFSIPFTFIRKMIIYFKELTNLQNKIFPEPKEVEEFMKICGYDKFKNSFKYTLDPAEISTKPIDKSTVLH